MSEVKRIRVLLHHIYRGPAWHGPAILEVLEGVDARTAAARPIQGVHTIWELVLHMTYWRRVAMEAFAGGALDPEPPVELNFPPVKDESDEAWQKALDGLEESQKQLLAALKGVSDERLQEHVDSGEYTYYFMLHGVVQHDIYHGGQIALLKKVQATS